jgi:hypothetical protein
MGKKIFSLNKVLVITKTKRKIARITGIPTTRTGRKNKLGRMIMKIFGL